MPAGDATIRPARTPADHAAFAALLGEYAAWCRARHADDPVLVDRLFGPQEFADELPALALHYGPPNGRMLLAVDADGRVGGGGAWHRLPDGSCEMKRVFVSDRLRGGGVGRRLCEAIVDDARRAGFALMRLDTSHRFVEAIALYESLGFRRCGPHQAYPPDIAGVFVFFELPLAERRPRA